VNDELDPFRFEREVAIVVNLYPRSIFRNRSTPVPRRWVTSSTVLQFSMRSTRSVSGARKTAAGSGKSGSNTCQWTCQNASSVLPIPCRVVVHHQKKEIRYGSC